MRVLAVAGGIEQIIDNLVDNAVEVSPRASRLTVSVTPHDRDIELHVVDEGPGMSDDDREHAFDRFWRGADATPGGSGLGLAIAQQLVAAGDGEIELRPASTGGTDAVVTLRSP